MGLRRRVESSPKGRLKPLEVTVWRSDRAPDVEEQRGSGESGYMLVILDERHANQRTTFRPPPVSI
jgi:hypothetical protein